MFGFVCLGEQARRKHERHLRKQRRDLEEQAGSSRRRQARRKHERKVENAVPVEGARVSPCEHQARNVIAVSV